MQSGKKKAHKLKRSYYLGHSAGADCIFLYKVDIAALGGFFAAKACLRKRL